MSGSDAEVEAAVQSLADDAWASHSDELMMLDLERIAEVVLAAVEPLMRERLAREVEAPEVGGEPFRSLDEREGYEEATDRAARIVRGDVA